MRRTCRLVIAAGLLLGVAANAGVVLDGSLGRSGAVSNVSGVYAITPDLGQTRGSNLFYSFSRFDLVAGETASFSGPASIQNVLARVTGGPSSIDGTIQCTIPNANFYLINPAGVVFGPNATLDVRGSFAVTTADVVKLSDGGQFHASSPASSVLTTAAPSAFGFLAARPAGITFNGSSTANVQVPNGKTLTIVGGNVSMNNDQALAPGGRISIVSAASPGGVTIDPITLAADFDPAHPPAGGDVTLTQSAIATDGPAGGRINVRAANLTANQTFVSASPSDANAGLGISLNLSGTLALTDTAVVTDATAAGRAGNIDVKAADFTIDSAGDRTNFSGLSARTSGAATGGAGAITVAANTLTILNGAQITADTSGAGPAGSVSVNVPTILLDGQGFDRSTSSDPLAGTGLYARTTSSGPAGEVAVSGTTLKIVNGASISAESNSAGVAGTVSVNSATLTIDDADQNLGTGIFADAFSAAPGGPRGAINLNAATLQVLNGGQISASAFDRDNAGAITINSTALTLQDQASAGGSLIASSSFAGGNAGTITLNAGSLAVTGKSLVAAATSGAGQGGTIRVNAGSVTLDAGALQAESVPSGPSAGNAGAISVQTGPLTLTHGGTINVGTAGPGRGGSISVNATDIVADATGTESNTGLFADSNVNGNNAATIGPAGTINVSGKTLSFQTGGSISASSAGSGKGGDVVVSLSGSLAAAANGSDKLTGIATNANGSGGGGDIRVTADSISLSSQASISSDTSGSGPAGNVLVRANSLQIAGGAFVSSDTLASGAGGNVDVGVGGALAIDGENLDATTGISASSKSKGAGGAAGVVRVSAGSVTVRRAGLIETNTAGSGAGGQVFVSSPAILLTDAPNNLFCGIAAFSRASGSGGSVNVVTDNLHVANGARISSESLADGAGGTVSVVATNILLDDPNGATGGGIVADATNLGRGGDVTVYARSLRIASAALLSASSFGTSDGGNVLVNARSIVLDGGTAPVFTGISAESNGSGVGGRAGDVRIYSADLRVLNGAEVTSSTFSSGPGGTVDLELGGGTLTVGGRNAGGAYAAVASSSNGTLPGGNGGNLIIRAGLVRLFAGGLLTCDSTGPGTAGTLSIDARGLRMLLSGISTGAPMSSGGDLAIHVIGPVEMFDSAISTEAGGAGGSVALRTPASIHLVHSSVFTQSGGNGGSITLDPSSVTFVNSMVSANGGVNGGNVSIRPDAFFSNGSTVTATGRTGVSGQVLLTQPDPSIGASLVQLPGTLASFGSQLAPQCGAGSNGSFSSFIVTGAGGAPPVPGGLIANDPNR